MTLLRSVAEVIIVRAAPGLVNLLILLLLGEWLSAPDYGLYSTAIATSGFIASMAFGPLRSAVVSQHAKLEAEGCSEVYESSLVSSALIVAVTLSALGAVPAAAGLISWTWIAPAITFGFYTAVQEIPHARVRFWSYGGAALTQALVLLALAWFFVRPHPEPAMALSAFAVSYAIAAVISLVSSGLPSLRWPDIAVIAGTFRVGVPYTMSLAIELGLYLGMRYVILLFGTMSHLGLFSFCVDLSRRLIGFLVNAASFVTVPVAFKADAGGAATHFNRTLLIGAAFGMGLAFSSFLAILIVRDAGWLAVLNTALFDPVVFAIISAAVVLNRVKKMTLDPIAMRARRTITIAAGFAFGTPVGLALGTVALLLDVPMGAEISYCGGYALATFVTAIALRRVLRNPRLEV